MTVVQVSLPDELERAIQDEVRAGRVADEADFLIRAGAFLASCLDAEDEIAAIAAGADAEIAAGDYVTVTSPEQAEAIHRETMARVRARLAAENAAR